MLRMFFLGGLLFSATPLAAQDMQRLNSLTEFVEVVEGRQLTRFGIKLTVAPSGDIRGRAFGKDVTGQWRWDAGYFCRDLFFGDEDLGPNCQLVTARGDRIRFTSDRGAGDSAMFKLR